MNRINQIIKRVFYIITNSKRNVHNESCFKDTLCLNVDLYVSHGMKYWYQFIKRNFCYSKVTACVCIPFPNFLYVCLVVFLILVKQSIECLTVCLLVNKKWLCYSQHNELSLPKLVRHENSLKDLFRGSSLAAILVSKGSDGVFYQ